MHTRSRKVEMPSGLSLPLATRCSRGSKYLPFPRVADPEAPDPAPAARSRLDRQAGCRDFPTAAALSILCTRLGHETRAGFFDAERIVVLHKRGSRAT